MKIYKHLTNSDSNIIAVAAGPQSTNGLVESYWKEHRGRMYRNPQKPQKQNSVGARHKIYGMYGIPSRRPSPLNNINIIALLTPPPRPHLLPFFAILPLFSTNVTCSQPSAAWGGVPEPPTI